MTERELLVAMIGLERQLIDILQTDAGAGVFGAIVEADTGLAASKARHGAMTGLLDVIDTRAEKGEA